jgi:hypothetical protein
LGNKGGVILVYLTLPGLDEPELRPPEPEDELEPELDGGDEDLLTPDELPELLEGALDGAACGRCVGADLAGDACGDL